MSKGTSYTERLLWGFFCLPFVAIFAGIRDPETTQLNPPAFVFFAVWEAVVVWIMVRKRYWPFGREGGR